VQNVISALHHFTWVVPDKGPLNGCVCVNGCVMVFKLTFGLTAVMKQLIDFSRWVHLRQLILVTCVMSHTHTPVYRPFVQDYPGEPVPEGKTNLDFPEARDSEWQWHQLGCLQVCT